MAAEARRATGGPGAGPPVGLSSGPLGAVQAADREIARQTALRARAVAAFAASRPASADRRQGEPGAMGADRWAARAELLRPVSEWAVKELVVALSLTAEAAEALLERSLALVHRLPATLAALESGALHPGHLWPMLDKVAPIESDELRAEVEACLLGWAAGRITTPAQLGAKARREVARRDARAAAGRLSRALRERGVHWRPEGADGMGSLTAVLSLPEAKVLHEALGAYADALDDEADDEADGPPRTRAQKMADCLVDLVLRPGETHLPPVQIALTVVAPVGTVLGGDEPGEVAGEPVPAEMVRHLLRALTDDRGTPAGARPDEAAATGAAATGPAATGTAATAPVVGAWQLAWQELEQRETGTWAAEAERRVLAGELDDPDPTPDEVLRAWAEAGAPDLGTDLGTDLDIDLGPDLDGDDPGADDLDDLDDLYRLDDADDDPITDGRTDGRARGTAARTDGDRWWVDADRAIERAGRLFLQAERATAHARRVVRTARAADAADEAAWRAGPCGRVDAARDALAALAAADERSRARLGDLLARTGGGGLVERPRLALTDALTGALRALTDLHGLRRAAHCGAEACRRRPEACDHDLTGRPGLGAPGPTAGYRPGAALDRWVRARDRRCRFPGCRRRVPARGELDHHRPWPAGATSADNLAGYCATDHRGKHQAPGWQHRLDPDGTLTVTTPTGLVAATAPPPY